MKKVFTTFVFVAVFIGAYSTDWVNINAEKPQPATIQLNFSDVESSIIQFHLNGYLKQEVITGKGNAYVIGLPGATPILTAGAPDLPKLTSSVIIPDLASMKVEVVSSSFIDYENIEIAPSKGNLYRDTDPSEVPFSYGDVYNINEFFPGSLTELRDPYIVRDYRGQTVVVYPFQYNPVAKTLRVYYDITVEITNVSDNGINQLVRSKPFEKVNHEFKSIYERQFMNARSPRYTPIEEYGNMLIICYGDFMDEMDDFIDWKIQKGTPTEIVDVASIGNTASAIKSYITSYYNDYGLTFVLLVGDAAQVTSSYSSGDSDNEYTYIVGSDHYPDIFIGRFSAETGAQVTTQVQRTLDYEKNPYTTEDWYSTAIGIASSQGPGDDGEYDYQHIRNINTDLLGFTYTYCHELFDGSQGGNDAPGNPTPGMVADAINGGATIINYTGHGSTNSWSSSGFSSSNVNSLTNNGMLPFIWSVACVNGNFVGGNCFAEAWLRAEDNGEPAGAVATLMSTINQSWNPPMCGQDEMNDILVESYAGNIKRTFAALSMNGCMQMNDEYGGQGDEMTDTWTVFGDPSVFVRTALPETMTTSYSNVTFIGTTELTIGCNADGGLACLTLDGEILATAFVDNGSATLQFEELEDYVTLTLTITAFNYLPHIGQIEVIQPDGPYLVYESHDIDDPNGNGNGNPDYAETVSMSLTLENMGNDDGVDIITNLNTSSTWVSMKDDSEIFDLIPAQGTATVENGYTFTVANNVPDMTEVTFDIESTDGETIWEDDFSVMIYAPVINIGQLTIDDSEAGNNNGVFDPGETVEFHIENSNNGHCTAYTTYGNLNYSSPYLVLSNSMDSIGDIAVLQSQPGVFLITADSATPCGEVVNFSYSLSFAGYLYTAEFEVEIGMLFEDWETGDFEKFDWQSGGDLPWMIKEQPYEGIYSSASGDISNNESSVLFINIEVNAPDDVSFYVKTSSEVGRDFLKFYIDNSAKGQWSGINDWGWVTFPITAGQHTLKWEYSKDDLLSFGDDCAWIDYIIFPPMPVLNAFAGQDNVVCEGNDFQCEGIAQNYVTLEWTTSGDGIFNDPNIEQPLYTPGVEDIVNEIVTLTFTAYGVDGNTDTDNMILAIINEPEQADMPSGSVYVDVFETPTSEYLVNPVPLTTSYMWYIEPAEAGTITGETASALVEWSQDFTGIATIAVRAVNDCGEGLLSEALEVTVNNTVDIDEELLGFFSIYPNPSNGQVFIKFTMKETVELSVIDLTGSLVFKQTVITENNQAVELNLSGLHDGIYFVMVSTVDERHVKKLILN